MAEIYKTYMEEEYNEKHEITKVSFHVNHEFNFAYDVVDVLAKKDPNKLALTYISASFEEKQFTYHDISRLSNQAANVLRSYGIEKGDLVMLLMKRRYDFWIVMMALHKLGAVAVPTSHMVSAEDILERIEKGKIKGIVCVNDDGICKCIQEATSGLQNPVIQAIVGGKREGYHDFDEDLHLASSQFARVATTIKEPMIVYFTSGSTGKPKAVMHDYTYPLGHILTAKSWHGVIAGGLHFSIADSGWAKSAWGKLYGQWLCECAVLVFDYERFLAREILMILEKYSVTSFCAPPTIYKYLVREDFKEYDLSSLQQAVSAGEPLPTQVAESFYESTGLIIREGFGQTETTLLIATMVGEEQKPGSIGKASPMYQIEIVDEQSNPLKPGECGEIVIRPQAAGEIPLGLFRGYVDDEELFASIWKDGVYHTRDRAYCDEDGYFFFVSRTDDVIKSSGYRIGPAEVEDILMKHPAVAECAVTGYPSVTRGQSVKATIALKSGFIASQHLKTELQDFVKERAAIYKYPRMIEFVPELPKTVTGKINRTVIRERDMENYNHKNK